MSELENVHGMGVHGERLHFKGVQVSGCVESGGVPDISGGGVMEEVEFGVDVGDHVLDISGEVAIDREIIVDVGVGGTRGGSGD